MTNKRIRRHCKSCGRRFSFIKTNGRPRGYCDVCREDANVDRPINVHVMVRDMPAGRYVVVKCEYGPMIGNVITKTMLAQSALDGSWPEGMMIFNERVRQVYVVEGAEQEPQRLTMVEELPETVRKRINCTFPS